MKELLILLAVVCVLSPNFLWKTYHGPVHYEHKKIEYLENIPMYSIVFVEWSGVAIDKFSIGIVDHEGLHIVFPLYDEEIGRYDQRVIMAISNSQEMLQRVISGDVKVLPSSYPIEKVNSFHIPLVKTFSVKMMNPQLEEIQNQFSYQVYSWHMHGSNHERNHIGYPDIQRGNPWFSTKPLLIENHMHPGEYKGIYLPVLFQSGNARYFHGIDTFSSLWPGSTIFLSRPHASKVIFAYHPSVFIKTDGFVQSFLLPPTGLEWVHLDVSGNSTRVGYYRLYVSSVPIFVP